MKDKYNLVGTKINDFKISNTRGETKSIRDFEGKANVLLVLFRSKS
ncbi:MAG: hypothetical protein ACFFA0_08260 [Promethearchaeota archaeon]